MDVCIIEIIYLPPLDLIPRPLFSFCLFSKPALTADKEKRKYVEAAEVCRASFDVLSVDRVLRPRGFLLI